MNPEIVFQPLAGSRLVSDYLHQRGAAQSFFALPPFSADAYRQHWSVLQPRFRRRQREAAAAALHPTSEIARQRLERWVEQGGAVVTTGQQAGLFTGPLYTIYKALTTARLAQELEARLGILVLPVFWTASEDHDWEEVNHTYLIDADHSLRRVELATGAPGPIPMSERRVDAGVEETIRYALRAFGGEEHGSQVAAAVRSAYMSGRTVAEAFGSLLATLLSPFDFCLTDAADPALKRASLPILQRELQGSPEHERLLTGTARQMEVAGYSVQVPILPGGSNLFFRTDYGRERLFHDPRGWISRETGSRLDLEELTRRLRRDPSSFSPNVLLRPVVESHAFPVLAYVAGPGEMAYWAQIKSLFNAHGVAMPAVYPRASAMLVETGARELLRRTGLAVDDLREPQHELVSRHAQASIPPEVATSLRQLRDRMVRDFDHLADAAAELDPTLVRAIGSRRNRALLEVHAVEKKVLRSVARSEHPWGSALDGAINHLLPLGQPQERVLNVLPFLGRHGPSLLRRIADGIAVPLQGVETSAPASTP